MDEYCVKLSNADPIAAVCGGTYDNKHVSIVKGDESDDEDRDPFEQLDLSDFIEKFKLMDMEERYSIVEALKNGKPNKLSGRFKESCKKSLKIDSGKFIIMPTKITERVYISGKSGVGKSSLASMYINEYSNMFPKRQVYLISVHSGESAYQYHDINQIPLNEEFVENTPTLEELSNSLVIFDDADNLSDNKLVKAVKALNDNLISNGRKYNIHVISMSHQLMDYSKTRHLLNEANRVVLFLAGSKYHTQRYLKVYAGFDKDQIKKIMGLKSRWVCLGLTIPNYYVSEHECGII